jgi:hypothetical protein
VGGGYQLAAIICCLSQCVTSCIVTCHTSLFACHFPAVPRCAAGLARAALQAFLPLLPADVALPPDVRAAIAAGNFARAVTALHAHLGLDEQARVTARLGAAVVPAAYVPGTLNSS